METAGLVNKKNDKIEVTSKGIDVIKTMLLGDERSSYEDDGEIIDYRKAASNIKPVLKTGTKVASKSSPLVGGWYRRLKNGYSTD